MENIIEKNMEIARKHYNKGESIEEWVEKNVKKGYGAGSVEYQCNAIKGCKTIANNVGLNSPIKIVSSHVSKSICLPVFCLKYSILDGNDKDEIDFYVFIRNNFHDTKLIVIGNFPFEIPYDKIHFKYSKHKFEKEKARAINYLKNSDSKTVELIEEDDDAWMKSWSHDFIIRDGKKIYRASGCQKIYCEGIEQLGFTDSVYMVYKSGKRQFGVCCSYVNIPIILNYLQNSMRKETNIRRYGSDSFSD